MNEKNRTAETTRREFFGRAIGTIIGLIGIGLSVPLLGYAIFPTLKKREESWSEVGTVDELAVNRPKEFEVVYSVKSGWMTSDSVRSVWAFRTPDGEVVAYSPICPHLGCGYRWESERGEFLCPCHNSVFDLSGRVLAGPAPRPLDTLPIRLDGKRLFVQYRQFKPGISKKQAV
jgi:menaquinol-cytochrome c reductase iron-sulfur subunit